LESIEIDDFPGFSFFFSLKFFLNNNFFGR